MMRGLVEAAQEMRRNELVLTNQDAQMLEDCGIEGPQRMDEYFRCVSCGCVMRENVTFLIMPNGDIHCDGPCGPEVMR
jgi:hypothetical protein